MIKTLIKLDFFSVEKILNNAESDVTVTIYNGNLDAISNTPGW